MARKRTNPDLSYKGKKQVECCGCMYGAHDSGRCYIKGLVGGTLVPKRDRPCYQWKVK